MSDEDNDLLSWLFPAPEESARIEAEWLASIQQFRNRIRIAAERRTSMMFGTYPRPLDGFYHYADGKKVHEDSLDSVRTEDWEVFKSLVNEYHPRYVAMIREQEQEIRLMDACSMAVDRPIGEELVDYDIIDKGETYTNSESFYAGAEWVRSIYERLIKEGYLIRNTKP